MEYNQPLLEEILHFIFTIKVKINEVDEVAGMLLPFVNHYPVGCKIVKSVFSVLIQNFYQEKMSHELLKMSVALLSTVMGCQRKEEGVPLNYFIMYG